MINIKSVAQPGIRGTRGATHVRLLVRRLEKQDGIILAHVLRDDLNQDGHEAVRHARKMPSLTEQCEAPLAVHTPTRCPTLLSD